MMIPSGATVCHICKSHQRRSLHLLQNIGIGAVLLPVLALVLPLIAFTAQDLKRRWFWRDEIQVLALHSNIYCTLRNAGSGTTYVTHLRYIWPEGHQDNVVSVNKVLQPGEYLSMGKGETAEREYEVVRGVAPGDTAGIVLSHIPSDCLRTSFLSKDDTALAIFRLNLKGSLRTAPGKGFVYFYGRDGSRIERQFPVEVVLERRAEERCQRPVSAGP
jgi:hypothetical protein